MEETTFQPGDVVRLRSGHPVMTVKQSDKGFTTCVYYNPMDGSIEEKELATVLLEKVNR